MLVALLHFESWCALGIAFFLFFFMVSNWDKILLFVRIFCLLGGEILTECLLFNILDFRFLGCYIVPEGSCGAKTMQRRWEFIIIIIIIIIFIIVVVIVVVVVIIILLLLLLLLLLVFYGNNDSNGWLLLP